jgi:DNA-binding NtrC family response regulator
MEKRYKILVIDDDLEMCGLLSDVLGQEGYSALTISQSLEASKTIKKEEFDVIVTDLRMKGLKGLDLLEEAKRVAPLTPVIIITAFGTIESAIQAMKRGAYDYITKPFQIEEFVLTAKTPVSTQPLPEAERLVRAASDCLIVGYARPDAKGEYRTVLNPPSTFRFQPWDAVLVLGTLENLKKLHRWLGVDQGR